MLPTSAQDGPHAHTRSLLQRLRDLNLASHRVLIREDLSISFAGCTSLDAPVEQGVSYRIVSSQSGPHTLTLRAAGGSLEIRLDSSRGERTILVALLLDEDGRASSPALAARLNLESAGERDYEHFMRRVVRGVFAA